MLQRYLLVTLVVMAMSRTSYQQSDKWKRYVEEYDLIQFTKYKSFLRNNNVIAGDFTGDYNIRGEIKTLPVTATSMLVFSQFSIPYWFKSNSILYIYTYFTGSPMKITTKFENGSIRVDYLGDRVDPFCKHLKCKHEVAILGNVANKKEVVDPNGWSVILGIDTPYTTGLGTKFIATEEELKCELKR